MYTSMYVAVGEVGGSVCRKVRSLKAVSTNGSRGFGDGAGAHRACGGAALVHLHLHLHVHVHLHLLVRVAGARSHASWNDG
jgi:hypothetical protein